IGNHLKSIESPNSDQLYFQGKNYYIEYILQGTFIEAYQFCKHHDMELLSISSKQEWDFLEENIKKYGHSQLT
ncbi:hypothetical protein NQ317_010771, partial [Molorchus minor]